MNLLKNLARWKNFFVISIICLIFSLMLRSLIISWNKIPLEKISFNWTYLLSAFAILFFCFCYGSYSWKITLKMFGENISFRKSLEIIALTQVGRYIPGKVWAIAGQSILAKRENISIQNAVTSVVLMNVGYVIANLIITSLCIGLSTIRFSLFSSFILVFIFIGGLCLMHPFIINKIIHTVKKLFKKDISIDRVPITFLNSLTLVIIFVVGGIIQAIGFCFLVHSFYDLKLEIYPLIIGSYAGAWVLGFLAIIMPAGIGVKEGALAYFLSFYIPHSVAIISSILARVWITVGELVLFTLFAKNLRKYFSTVK
ncbi:MAG: lysylphosphatidylglycerol synthase domain-containing protein [candidate division WOR-3 bacterium]